MNVLSPDFLKTAKIEFSSHVLEQMQKRGIQRQLVEHVIKNGFRVKAKDDANGNQAVIYMMGAFRVFIAKHPMKNIPNIVTTYWADEHTGLTGGYQPKDPAECERLLKLRTAR
jgi:uncharacterized protein YdaL